MRRTRERFAATPQVSDAFPTRDPDWGWGASPAAAWINPGHYLPGCPGGVGLTTALTVLPTGWVIVGSLPTQGGAISGSGCLIVLNFHGNVQETFTGYGINGPWDLTSVSLGAITDLFVTNVLNLFGLAVKPGADAVYFVDDFSNTLNLLF